jgi:putative ABC transport system permease protein
VGRLALEASIEEAQNEVDILAARSTADHSEYYPDPGCRFRLRPFQSRVVGSIATPLYVLMGAVGFVLLTACVNLANLLLARGEARKREIAIRHAVGASRIRVARLLLIESLLLAAVGGAVGLIVADLGVDALLALAPAGLPRLNNIGVDNTVLVFSTAIAVATGLTFGLLPALRSASVSPADSLKRGGRAFSGDRAGNIVRRVLVSSQVALAVLLVVGAGLMARTVLEMYGVDTGFDTTGIAKFRLHPSGAKYDTPQSGVTLYGEIINRIERLPGVAAASATSSPPLSELGWGRISIVIEGRPAVSIGETPAERVEHITPGYLETIGITLVRGRAFTNADDINSLPVVVINESMASAHWPNEDPIGKRFRVHGDGAPFMEVVGVVRDVRHLAVNQEPSARWYVPHAQAYESAYTSPLSMALLVRSETDIDAMIPTLLEAVRTVDGSLAISRVLTLDQVFSGALKSERFVAILLVLFGAMALVLAAVGVYGVISYAVSQRTHEIGIRMALGAKGSSVLVHVMCEGLRLTAVGVVLGLLAALVLSRVLSSMVFGIDPTDPATYAGVAVALCLVALLASLIPARRASGVSPLLALREET